MPCTVDHAETNSLGGCQPSSRKRWAPAATTSKSSHMALSGDDTGNSCSHATLPVRTRSQETLRISSRLIILWRFWKNRDCVTPFFPELNLLYRSMVLTIQDVPRERARPQKDCAADVHHQIWWGGVMEFNRML